MGDAAHVTAVRTERLLLRRWRDADRAAYAAMNQDPAVMEFLQGRQSPAVSNTFIDRVEAHWDDHGWGLWAIEVPGIAPFVGFTGLWPATHVLGYESREVGWRLARAHWGKGYATEAAREALRFGFSDIGFDEIVSFTVPANLRSRAVMERIGLAYVDGADFDHPRVDAVAYPHIVRHVLYRLDHATWEHRRSA
jgi:RimJ/RimL family protein N-acetyltransferase